MPPRPHPPQAVIFDLDGILVDSEPLHVEAWRQLFAEDGVTVTAEEFHHGIGMGDAEWLTWLFRRRGQKADLAQWQAAKRGIYREVLAANVRPFPGVIPLVRRLRRAGLALGVASNSWRENIETVLAATGLTDCFDAWTGKEDVARPKPDPEPYLRTARELGLPPSVCTVIEDSDLGLLAARRAGMRCIAVPNTLPPERLSGADLIVQTLADAAPVLRFLGIRDA